MHEVTPLSVEKPILDKHYGRTKRFTNAVNQMKAVLKNIAKDQEQKRTERMRYANRDDEQRKLIESVQRRNIKIILTKLKPEEMEKWSPKPHNSFAMVLRKR